MMMREAFPAAGTQTRRDPIVFALPTAVGFLFLIVAPLAVFITYSFMTAKLFAVS